jgi:hypothetical protein
MNKITMLGLLIGLAVVVAPLSACAQCIQVTPENWDYGDVKVGTAKSQVFTIASCASTSLTVYIIEITDDPTGGFAVTSAPDLPVIIYPGEPEEVEVTFTPPSLGAHEGFLHIFSNAPGNHTYINLSGVGVRGWRCSEAKIAP